MHCFDVMFHLIIPCYKIVDFTLIQIDAAPSSNTDNTGAGVVKPCALLRLDFLTSAANKIMHSLVTKSRFSKAQELHETCMLKVKRKAKCT